MKITQVASGQSITVTIRAVEDQDYKKLTKKRYSFNWRPFGNTADIYKLCLAGEEDILGVMGIIDIPAEKRIEIKLLACAEENIGSKKVYDGIAGCLIGFAGRMAVEKYGVDACISLIPKTELTEHYIKRYHMLNAGRQLYLEGRALIKLLSDYIL